MFCMLETLYFSHELSTKTLPRSKQAAYQSLAIGRLFPFFVFGLGKNGKAIIFPVELFSFLLPFNIGTFIEFKCARPQAGKVEEWKNLEALNVLTELFMGFRGINNEPKTCKQCRKVPRVCFSQPRFDLRAQFSFVFLPKVFLKFYYLQLLFRKRDLIHSRTERIFFTKVISSKQINRALQMFPSVIKNKEKKFTSANEGMWEAPFNKNNKNPSSEIWANKCFSNQFSLCPLRGELREITNIHTKKETKWCNQRILFVKCSHTLPRQFHSQKKKPKSSEFDLFRKENSAITLNISGTRCRCQKHTSTIKLKQISHS